MATDIEIIVGTYEEFVVGFRPQFSTKDPSRLIMCKSFADHGHSASVRTVASCEQYLATGGADDKIFVYSLKTREQLETLLHHNGTINALAFTPDAKFLLTGGSDGQIAAINVKKMKKEKVWNNAHKGAVKHISIHPTGKLALTLGDDKTIRTWNLINGRQAYATNLKNKEKLGGVSDYVEWSPDGDFFALSGAKTVEIWSIDTGFIARSQECAARPTGICWISNEELIVAMENGQLMAFNITDLEINVIPISTDSRIKCMHYLNGFLAVATSNGDLMLFQITENNTVIDEVCFTNIGCRPTCLVIVESKKYGMDFEVKQEEDEEDEKDTVLGADAKPEKVRPPVQTRGTITVEFEDDDAVEQQPRKKQKTEKVKTEVAEPENVSPKKKQAAQPEEPVEVTPKNKSKKNKKEPQISDEVGELDDIIEETVVRSSSKKKKPAEVSDESAIEMPPPKSSSIKKSKKKKKADENEETIIETPVEEPKARKKIKLDEEVVTPKRKPKRTSESEKTPVEDTPKTKKNTPPAVDVAVETPASSKRKQKKSKSDDETKTPKNLAKAEPEKVQEPKKKNKMNKTMSEVESIKTTPRTSARTASKKRKSIG